jgi:hypothetical protein
MRERSVEKRLQIQMEGKWKGNGDIIVKSVRDEKILKYVNTLATT